MKDIIEMAIEKHGRIIVAKYTSLDTKIEHRNSLVRTEGGMYILEDLTINKNEMVYDEEHKNTWDFQEVQKWTSNNRSQIHQLPNEKQYKLYGKSLSNRAPYYHIDFFILTTHIYLKFKSRLKRSVSLL